VVPDLQEEEGYQHDHDDRPEIDELRREDGGVAVRQDCEVVALDIQEREDDVFPAIFGKEADVARGFVAVQGVGRVDDVEEDIVPKRLKGGD